MSLSGCIKGGQGRALSPDGKCEPKAPEEPLQHKHRHRPPPGCRKKRRFVHSGRTVEARVSADLAVHTLIAGSLPAHLEQVPHDGALPELRNVNINLYYCDPGNGPVIPALVALIRQAFCN